MQSKHHGKWRCASRGVEVPALENFEATEEIGCRGLWEACKPSCLRADRAPARRVEDTLGRSEFLQDGE